MSKSFFVVEAAGLEPALSQEAEAKTEVQNVKQHHCLACMPFPIPYTGLCFHCEAEGPLAFHHYPVDVRLDVLKPKPMTARFTPGYMILTKVIV